MQALLIQIEEAGTIPLNRFLSRVAIQYGIRRKTALEYINDWLDGGYISIENQVIHFISSSPIEQEQTTSTSDIGVDGSVSN